MPPNPPAPLTEEEKALLAALRDVVQEPGTNIMAEHDKAALRLFPLHGAAFESVASRFGRGAFGAAEDPEVLRIRRSLETIDSADLQDRVELFMKLLMQCGHEILELWVTNGAHYLDKEQSESGRPGPGELRHPVRRRRDLGHGEHLVGKRSPQGLEGAHADRPKTRLCVPFERPAQRGRLLPAGIG